MIFTAVLPADVALPEETWLHARVRKHGLELEVAAEGGAVAPAPPATTFDAWLAKAAGSSKAGLSTDEILAMTRGED